MGIQQHDLAILTARFGAARFGATRFGFIPCPEDVQGTGTAEPGEYVWKEETPPSQETPTDWTLASEDCVCRQLCTLALGTITLSATPLEDLNITASVTLSGVLGLVEGIARINWGDGRHDQQDFTQLENEVLEFSGHYHIAGSYTITVTVIDERGCDVTKTLPVTVGVASTLAVTFVIDSLPANVTDPLTFTPTVTPGTPPYTYDWDFGDGSTHSTDEIPIHTFNDPMTGGTYTTTLTVTDADTAQAQHDETFDIAGV